MRAANAQAPGLSHEEREVWHALQWVFAAGLACYSLAGLMHGSLAMFVLDGFFIVKGLPALMYAGACLCLALAWAAVLLNQRDKLAEGAVLIRGLLLAFAVLVAAAFLVAMLAPPASAAVRRSWGLSPASDAPLFPIALTWRLWLPFALDAMVWRMVAVSVMSLAAMFLCHAFRMPRAYLFFMGLLVLPLAAYFLGDGAYQYVTSRQLAGPSRPEFAAGYRSHPGEFNAWLVACQVMGGSMAAFGCAMVYAAFRYSEPTTQRLVARWQAAK